MFFKKSKRPSSQSNMLSDEIHQLHIKQEDCIQRIARMQEKLDSAISQQNMNKKIQEDLCGQLNENTRELRQHHMALEDFLDTVEEQCQCHEKISSLQSDNQALLQSCLRYYTLLWNMENSASSPSIPDSFIAQLRTFHEQMEPVLQKCGIQIIDQTGISVDYTIHEVTAVSDTGDAALDRKVAQILTPGFIYKGNIHKKARVLAFRLAAKETEMPSGHSIEKKGDSFNV
ncbi:molecular chaperone GrpE (heat shock protein) [Catenibacillus scindens]|uniref:Molecular chaperone GrpE (Heat shock protein) n=1 Tax=Catenibacillus scindens TaxID=673271 RepID=A0A7W8HAR5_9FIRM|nr:nucleotide exchange factor GrpE [Catenibacillus scindens]MBB5264904.1 molecular chaperone GrpE (heat shock protein) [Catenibacillus scindens]